MTQLKGKQYLKAKSKKTKFQHYPLKNQVLKLLQDSNFRKPTLVQAQSMPITLQQNLNKLCIIIYAYNGAGKTLTYLIPVLNALENIPDFGYKYMKQKQIKVCRPQALILVPTQALLSQVYQYLDSYSAFYEQNFRWNLKIGKVYSNSNTDGHILIGMPNKMQVKLKSGNIDLSQLKWIVFDQCDKMQQDTKQDFTNILKHFNDKTSNINTNLLITSATGKKDQFRKYIQTNLSCHNVLQLDSKDQNKGLQGVFHFYSRETAKKDQIIFDILKKISEDQNKPQVIIFFNTIAELRAFYNKLLQQQTKFVVNHAKSQLKNNLKVDYIHTYCTNFCRRDRDHLHPHDCAGSKTQRIKRLKNKQVQIMLGTQSIGRGIDIRTVVLVINYNQPMRNKQQMCPTAYIHRVGRTGRYSDQGVGLTFVNDDTFIKMAQEQQKINFQKMEGVDQIVNFAIKCSLTNNKAQAQDKHRYHLEQ